MFQTVARSSWGPIVVVIVTGFLSVLGTLNGCGATRTKVLNAPVRGAPTVPPEQLPAELEAVTEAMFRRFVHGRKVDYAGLRDSPEFQRYRALVGQLPRFSPELIQTTEQRLAFWINLYNTLVIHAVVDSNARGSVRRQLRFFDRYGYRIGEHLYTPNLIEHGILRGVSLNPDDPRFRYVLPRLDPRIHFALNCASWSCPPLRAYHAATIDQELDAAARAFVNDPNNLRLDSQRSVLWISKIFQWYQEDFGFTDDAVVEFLLETLPPGPAREFLEREGAAASIEYLDYDWSLNSADRSDSVRD